MDSKPITPSRTDAEAWKLVLDHLRLIDFFATRAHQQLFNSSLSQVLSKDDLMEIGTLKAFEVAKRYDNSRGVTFSSYLAYRIIGHFLDICHPDRRRPEKIQMFSIDAVAQMGLESFYLEDPSSLDEQDLIDLYESLFQIWRRLTPRETQVLDIMLRNEGITLQAVADQLGLTESRISQLRQSIYTKYKELIQ